MSDERYPQYSNDHINTLLRLLPYKPACRFMLSGLNDSDYYYQDKKPYCVFVAPAVDYNGAVASISAFLDKTKLQADDKGKKKDKKDVFDEVAPILKLNDSVSCKILFPYHDSLTAQLKDHWLTAEITIEKKKQIYTVSICAHDPAGGGDLRPDVRNMLKKTLEDKIRSLSSTAKIETKFLASKFTKTRQSENDKDSYGVIMVEELMQCVKSEPLDKKPPYEKGAQELRKNHIDLVKDRLPPADESRINFLKDHKLSETVAVDDDVLARSKKRNNKSKDLLASSRQRVKNLRERSQVTTDRIKQTEQLHVEADKLETDQKTTEAKAENLLKETDKAEDFLELSNIASRIAKRTSDQVGWGKVAQRDPRMPNRINLGEFLVHRIDTELRKVYEDYIESVDTVEDFRILKKPASKLLSKRLCHGKGLWAGPVSEMSVGSGIKAGFWNIVTFWDGKHYFNNPRVPPLSRENEVVTYISEALKNAAIEEWGLKQDDAKDEDSDDENPDQDKDALALKNV